MKQFGKLMLLALGFGLLAIALSSIPNQPALAGPGVTIVSPLPLPVSGMVGVNNFPDIQPISGTVSIAGPSTVNISNTSANPVPITDVAPFQMFQASCERRLNFRDNVNNCIIGVPAGKRLVVQTISVHAEVDPGVRVSQAAAEALGTATILWLNVPFTGTTPNGAFDISQATQELRLYADGGTSSIEFDVLYNSDTTDNDLRCTVVGYLVNLP